jgi:hypothetical protein
MLEFFGKRDINYARTKCSIMFGKKRTLVTLELNVTAMQHPKCME